MSKCLPKKCWLEGDDGNGRDIRDWCKIDTENNNVTCNICHSTLNCTLKGRQAILQHALTKKHIQNVKAQCNPLKLHLTGVSATPSSSASSNQLGMYCLQDSVIKAEILWALKMVKNNISARACEDIGPLFNEMFNCEISKQFTMGRTKFGYFVTDALGPHFREQLLHDIGNEYFSICFDETTNHEQKKELQIKIRYFSEAEGVIVEKHLETFFITHAAATDLVKCLKTALDNASLCQDKLLRLGSDGPNVNKRVYSLFNEEVKSRGKPLLDIGKQFCFVFIIF